MSLPPNIEVQPDDGEVHFIDGFEVIVRFPITVPSVPEYSLFKKRVDRFKRYEEGWQPQEIALVLSSVYANSLPYKVSLDNHVQL